MPTSTGPHLTLVAWRDRPGGQVHCGGERFGGTCGAEQRGHRLHQRRRFQTHSMHCRLCGSGGQAQGSEQAERQRTLRVHEGRLQARGMQSGARLNHGRPSGQACRTAPRRRAEDGRKTAKNGGAESRVQNMTENETMVLSYATACASLRLAPKCVAVMRSAVDETEALAGPALHFSRVKPVFPQHVTVALVGRAGHHFTFASNSPQTLDTEGAHPDHLPD